MCKQTLAEEIFGVVSDFRGAWGAGKQKQENVPVSAARRTPHWHDSCFTGNEMNVEDVTEAELCSHF